MKPIGWPTTHLSPLIGLGRGVARLCQLSTASSLSRPPKPRQSRPSGCRRKMSSSLQRNPNATTSLCVPTIVTDFGGLTVECPAEQTLGTTRAPGLRKIASRANFPLGSKPECRVLVLHTGGTIGMIKNDDNALVCIPDALVDNVRLYPELHDAEYAKERFGANQARRTLVLPDVGEKCRVVYTVCEYDPVLDSSNMTLDDWKHIARDIDESYEEFDGFVVLHGTDTLAHTASALSFMLENLGKPVVLTGSQIPIFEARTDGRDNFLGALVIAGNYNVPEVSVFFGNRLLRGNRTVKVSAHDYRAFSSPNMSPLVTVGIDIEVDYKAIFRPLVIEKFRAHKELNPNVGILRIFPGITLATVRAFLGPPMQGVVLQTFGAGNVPSNRADLVAELRDAVLRGVLVVSCTQCARGGVSAGLYETGKILHDLGVVPGADMTPEAALAKLSYVLSKDTWDMDKKRQMLGSNLRGELSAPSLPNAHSADLVEAVSHCLGLTAQADKAQLADILHPALLCAGVAQCDLRQLAMLADKGADLSAVDADLRTALHVAACQGSVAVVKHLLLNGANVHAKDRFEQTPLLNAVEFDRSEVITLLMAAGAHLTGSLTVLGEKLCSAAARGHVKRLRSLQLAGANLGQPDPSGNTALHMAALHGNVDCIHLLLDAGVGVCARNMKGETAQDLAIAMGRSELTDRLTCT